MAFFAGLAGANTALLFAVLYFVGGAPLLGFDHLLIKAHGRSQAGANQNAIKVAKKGVASGLLPDIERGLREADLSQAPQVGQS